MVDVWKDRSTACVCARTALPLGERISVDDGCVRSVSNTDLAVFEPFTDWAGEYESMDTRCVNI